MHQIESIGGTYDAKPLKPDPARLRAIGKRAMISTSHPLATEAGLAALKKGGNAVDAYLTAALTQTVLEPVMTTIGGGLGLTFYDAGSGAVFLVGGGFPDAEGEMGEISRRDLTAWRKAPVPGFIADPEDEMGDFSPYDLTTGRTVLVPGFIAGVHAASQRFGRLPWEELFEAAIHYAREGFLIDHILWGWTYEYRRWLGRYPEGREIWFPEGHMLGVGDVLRQPKLATTLQRIRDEGPEYFYRGAWSRNFVKSVRARGSRITQDDMTKVLEGAPDRYVTSGPFPRGQYREYEVVAPANAMVVFALNLVQAGDLRSRGRPTEEPDTLYYLMRIVQEAWHTGFLYVPETHDTLMSKAHAEQAWKVIEGGPPGRYRGISAGTCAVTVVDEVGNVACGSHSSSSSPYGTGIVVDGVVLNRVIFHRTSALPAGINTDFMLFKDGKPVWAVGSPSRSFFSTILQNTVNVFEFGMDPWESVNQPLFGAPGPAYPGEEIETSFPEAHLAALEERGMEIMPVGPWEIHMGSCHAILIDRDGGRVHGVADPRRLGMAKGY